MLPLFLFIYINTYMITDHQAYIDLQNNIKQDARLYTAAGKVNSAVLRRASFQQSDLCAQITQATNFLQNHVSIAERLYCISQQIIQTPTCVCGKPLKFISTHQGYLKSCNKCIRKIGTVWKSSGATTATNITQERQELLDYINDSNATQASLEQVIEFIAIKMQNNAECIKWVSREDFRINKPVLKAIVSLTPYIPLSIDQYHWPRRLYNIYHNTHQGQLCVVCKTNKTRFKNFTRGYTDCCSNKACVQAHGCKNRVANHLATITPIIFQQGFDVLSGENFNGINRSKLTLHCRACSNQLDVDVSNATWKHIRCNICHGNVGVSYEEKTVLAFIKQLGHDALENHHAFTSSTKELDIYIPDRKLAIEYNGSLWHSFGTCFPNNFSDMNTHKHKHYEKYKLCADHDIKLLQINSHEWNNLHKQIIWKSIISNHLGASHKVHARKCKVVELASKQANDFLNANHLQGMDNSKVKLGLVHDDTLVSVMTFSKPRFNKSYKWELVRFCNLLNHTVVGGASKLMKFFINKHNPTSLISYADVRYSNGNLYKQLGFKLVKHTTPSYVYIKSSKIISRFGAQKHKLQQLLEAYDANKTETQNMIDAGYRKLWDAGTLLYAYA